MLTIGRFGSRWFVSTTGRSIAETTANSHATVQTTAISTATATATATIYRYQGGLHRQCRRFKVPNGNRCHSKRWFSNKEGLPPHVDVGTRLTPVGVQELNDDDLDDDDDVDVELKRNPPKSKIRIDFQNLDDDNYEKDNHDDASTTRKSKNNNNSSGLNRKGFTNMVELRMPSEAIGFPVAKIKKWHKQEGDMMQYEDEICDIELEDCIFTLTVDDEYDTIMGEILVPEGGENVPDGTVICETWHPVETNKEDEK